MNSPTEIKKFKGGSLSGTYLFEQNKKFFIRKKVSLVENREFGFYRWLSQLKKLQSLGRLFPDLFPKILNIGTENNRTFYDMEFFESSINGFEFLKQNPPKVEIDIFFQKLLSAMEKIHSIKITSYKGGLDLYIDQEVKRAVEFCEDDEQFKSFLKHKTIIFNGQNTPPLIPNLEKFYALAQKCYTSPQECLTHGNITLENILYIPNQQKIIFIDLYQENYIDTVYNEYSQILQSSNSYYEVYNSDSLVAEVKENSVQIKTQKFAGIDYFNQLFKNFLKKQLSSEEYTLTKLYEVSQFTRMLPFKKTVAKDKMIFFYALASNLFASINT